MFIHSTVMHFRHRLLCALALIIALASTSHAAQFGDFTYELINGDTGVEITGYPDDAVGSVVIPAEIDGLPVTSVGHSAFSYCANLTSVTLPSSLTSIGPFAFSYCSSLHSITLPADLNSIGSAAFLSCDQLPSIDVATGNSWFHSSDGALFNASLTELIAYPAGRGGAYSLPPVFVWHQGSRVSRLPQSGGRHHTQWRYQHRRLGRLAVAVVLPALPYQTALPASALWRLSTAIA